MDEIEEPAALQTSLRTMVAYGLPGKEAAGVANLLYPMTNIPAPSTL
jgi:hypothetical protein